MALKDKIAADNRRVFMNPQHFAERHTWNGIAFWCVTDEEAALKRKNNNVVDVSWDNNTTETLVYVPASDWPGRRIPNEHGFFDRKPVKILQIEDNMDMLSILLVSNDPKAVSQE